MPVSSKRSLKTILKKKKPDELGPEAKELVYFSNAESNVRFGAEVDEGNY